MNKLTKEQKEIAAIGIIFVVIFIIGSLIISGCGQSKFLSDNTFQWSGVEIINTAHFQNDSLFYVAQTGDSVERYSSPVTLEYSDSSLFIVVLDPEPSWWDSNTWEVVETERGIRSVRTQKEYLKVDHKEFLRVW